MSRKSKKRAASRSKCQGFWKLYYYFKSIKHPFLRTKSVPSHKELLAMAEEHFKISLAGYPTEAGKLLFALSHIQNIPLASIKKKAVTPKPAPKKNAKLSPGSIAYIVSDEFLASYEWRRVRYEALKLSDGTCCLCGRGKPHGVVLNADHIKPRRKYPELALEVNNIQILCNDCNHGKGNWDQTDWK